MACDDCPKKPRKTRSDKGTKRKPVKKKPVKKPETREQQMKRITNISNGVKAFHKCAREVGQCRGLGGGVKGYYKCATKSNCKSKDRKKVERVADKIMKSTAGTLIAKSLKPKPKPKPPKKPRKKSDKTRKTRSDKGTKRK